jgi:hypothetical protein
LQDQRRFAVQPELMKQLMRALGQFGAALVRARLVEVPDVIEMGEFGADPAEIVPDTGEDGLDLLRRFFREGRGQIGAADALLAQPRPDQTGDPAERVGGLLGVEIAGGAQQADGQRADGGFAKRFGRVPQPRLGTSQQRMHMSGYSAMSFR